MLLLSFDSGTEAPLQKNANCTSTQKPTAACFHLNANRHSLRRISNCTLLSDSVRYASTCQVVWSELDTDAIARKYLNKVLANLAGDVRQNAVTVIEFDPKHGIGQGFLDCPLEFNYALLDHANSSFGRLVSISGSPSVIKIECSKCAEGL